MSPLSLAFSQLPSPPVCCCLAVLTLAALSLVASGLLFSFQAPLLPAALAVLPLALGIPSSLARFLSPSPQLPSPRFCCCVVALADVSEGTQLIYLLPHSFSAPSKPPLLAAALV